MLTSLFLRLTYVGAEWVLWILLLLSIISIALMVERWLYFFRTSINSDELAAGLDEQLRAKNLQGAWQLVKDTHTQSIESAVVAAGLIALRNGAHAATEAMLSVKAKMRPRSTQISPSWPRSAATRRSSGCSARCSASSTLPTS